MLLTILSQYFKTLWDQKRITTTKKLKKCQQRRWNLLKKNVLPHSPFYKPYLDKPLEQFPIINKTQMMEHFDSINTVGLNKQHALQVALEAEQSRDFSPMIKGFSVGLSSGTSGQRGLFVVSPKEQAYWVGTLLAKALPNSLLHRESIAFFLRANNNLYENLAKSRTIQFHYFDLSQTLSSQIPKLMQIQPTIVSAPATVLLELAHAQKSGELTIHPKTLFSVAEVLEPLHQSFIENVFAIPVKQIYQCTEGFLGISNANNFIQLNEENLIIEKEWLDQYRFIPIITDLKRHSQPIIRYRLDDVLVVHPNANSPFTGLARIEGREGDICLGVDKSTLKTVPIFADLIRQKIASCQAQLNDYQLIQKDTSSYSIATLPELPHEHKQRLEQHLNQLFDKLNCQLPQWQWQAFNEIERQNKKRRIQSNLSQRSTSL